jgi:hypothetical protein
MALKPCRECKQEVSTSAKVCPSCGIQNPARSSSSSGCGIALLAVLGLGALALFGASNQTHELTPEEKAKQALTEKKEQEDKAAFSEDYDRLSGAGRLAVISGDANKYEISGWHSSLDLYISNRLELKAAALADFFCHQRLNLKRPSWKVRVYMADGSVGAECPLN